jgi:hypothetical protein
MGIRDKCGQFPVDVVFSNLPFLEHLKTSAKFRGKYSLAFCVRHMGDISMGTVQIYYSLSGMSEKKLSKVHGGI